MSNEWKVCTKEQAEWFVKNGIVLETQSSWFYDAFNKANWRLTSVVGSNDFVYAGRPTIPAPDVAELGFLLPDHIHISNELWNLVIWKASPIAWGVDYFNENDKPLFNAWNDKQLARVMADRYTKLFENGHLKAEDIKL